MRKSSSGLSTWHTAVKSQVKCIWLRTCFTAFQWKTQAPRRQDYKKPAKTRSGIRLRWLSWQAWTQLIANSDEEPHLPHYNFFCPFFWCLAIQRDLNSCHLGWRVADTSHVSSRQLVVFTGHSGWPKGFYHSRTLCRFSLRYSKASHRRSTFQGLWWGQRYLHNE